MPSFHGRSKTDRSVNPTEVVIRKVQAVRRAATYVRRSSRPGGRLRGGGPAVQRLAQLALHFLQPIRTPHDLARFAAVRWTDYTLALHHVEDSRRAPVTQAQSALERGGGRLAHFQHHSDG